MKNILLYLSVLLSTLSYTQTGSSQEVGITDGQLSVSLTGAATYNIPILVPPGINGVEPKISLVYNSQSGNGIAGYGWNISGASVITRIPASKFYDNTIDGVDFDQYDRFALDGQRLILKSGTYGGNGAVYETESFSNLKIISYGVSPFGANFGPAYFKVFYPDGSQATFGNTNNSRSKNVWGIRIWKNPQDIRIYYRYTMSYGNLFINKISYGKRGVESALYSIEFGYYNRNIKEETYIKGQRFLNTKILKNIRVFRGSSNDIRFYELEHDNTSLGYERLVKITEKIGATYNNVELNPTVFTYEDTGNDILEKTTSNIGLNNIDYSNTDYISGDFNEDGKMDVIIYHTSGNNPRENFTLFTSVYTNHFTNGITYNFGHSVDGFVSLHPAKILYQNKLRNGWIGVDNYSSGQGIIKYTKFVFIGNQIIRVSNVTPILGSGTGKKIVISGDFNGDATTDLMTFKNFYTTDVWLDGVGHIGHIDEVLSPGPYANPVPFKIYTGDYNGDGKTDIYILRENKLKVYSLNQQNNSLIRIATIYDNDLDLNKPCLMGDYNGDGKTDFVIPETLYQDSWNFYFSKSNNTFIKKNSSIGIQYTKDHNGYAYSPCHSNGGSYFSAKINKYFFSTDINSDGKTDIIYFSNTIYWNSGNNVSSVFKIAENIGTNSQTVNFQTNSNDSVFCNTGINEKPIPILLDNNETNQNLEFAVISNNKIHHFKNINNHQQEVLLREITNGNGVKEKIHYSQLTTTLINNVFLYKKSTNTNINYPYINIGNTPSFQVVSKLEKFGGPIVGVSPYSKQIFSYYGAVSNVQGLGFMGFSKILKTNWFNDDHPIIMNVTWHDFNKRGAITDSFSKLNDGYIMLWDLGIPSVYINRVEKTYNSSLSTSKVFKIKNINTKSYNGKLLTKTNPFNLTTTYEYDIWGKLTKETDFLGNEKSIVYSRAGHTGNTSIAVFNPDGSKNFQLLDPLGRVFLQKSYGFSELWVNQKKYYDIYDRIIKTTELYDINSPSHQYQYNFYTYDDYGRKTQIALFNGKTTDISYDGLTTIATDGYKTTTTTKNALGQVVELVDDGGTILYEYYANGKLKQTNFEGNITSMEYDGWGKKTKLIDTSAGEYTYEYNDFGEIIKEITPNGETNYNYNNIGKLTRKHITGSGTDLLSTYIYDNTSKLLKSIQTNQNTFYIYIYDNYKRLIGTNEYHTGDSYRYYNSVTYDNLSRIKTERKKTLDFGNGGLSSDITTKNIYKNGALWKILDNSNQNILWQLSTVNARGQVEESIFGNDIKENITYDSYGLISNITSLNNITDNTLIQLDYNFDQERGLLLSRSNSLFNFSENFAYDNLNRLTSFTNINGQQGTQTYDSKGRIKTNNIGSHYYNGAKPYQLTTIKPGHFGYNYYLERPLQIINYNAFKAPINITEDGHDSINFKYNVFQQRSSMKYDRQTGGVYNKEKFYTTDGKVEIKHKVNEGYTEIITYIGGDGYSAPIIYKSNGTTNRFEYLHRDNQGTIIAVSNQQANLIEKRAFDAWGNIAHLTDGQDNNLTELTVIDRGYTGHEHLAKVGLINMNARLYDAKLHRFLASDNFVQDIFNTQNYNRYSYVLNNPLSYVDPSGEAIPLYVAAIIGAAVGVATNGIQNYNNDRPIFQGAIKSMILGGIAGGASYLIGGIAAGMQGFSSLAYQTLMHAYLGGVMSGLNGGQFIHGFISGGVGSMVGYIAGDVLSNVKSGYLQAGGMVFSGAIAGGVASEISGGKFWDGFRNGLISAGLNHAAHYAYATGKKMTTISQILKELDLKGNKYVDIKYDNDALMSLIDISPTLRMFYEAGGIKNMVWIGSMKNWIGEYNYFLKTVFFNGNRIANYRQLISTALHEFRHGWQYSSRLVERLRKNGYGEASNEYSRTSFFMEYDAYQFEITSGNSGKIATSGRNFYLNKFINY